MTTRSGFGLSLDIDVLIIDVDDSRGFTHAIVTGTTCITGGVSNLAGTDGIGFTDTIAAVPKNINLVSVTISGSKFHVQQNYPHSSLMLLQVIKYTYSYISSVLAEHE